MTNVGTHCSHFPCILPRFNFTLAFTPSWSFDAFDVHVALFLMLCVLKWMKLFSIIFFLHFILVISNFLQIMRLTSMFFIFCSFDVFGVHVALVLMLCVLKWMKLFSIIFFYILFLVIFNFLWIMRLILMFLYFNKFQDTRKLDKSHWRVPCGDEVCLFLVRAQTQGLHRQKKERRSLRVTTQKSLRKGHEKLSGKQLS